MKKFICILMLAVLTLTSASCTGNMPSATNNTSSSLSDIQNAVSEAQTAFEKQDLIETEKCIGKLLTLSEDPLYSESERLIAQYCAIYIKSGVMLDYIIRNDIKWLETHNVDEFDIFHSGLFVEIINGNVTHIDTLKEYISSLVHSTREIYLRYTELTGN